ncbi:MAG TPA: nuclear transport factor 2 family protein [Polyangia bacterium]|nr:nuclear transport factor 2 family protein [Polyangia bacterium]
MSQDRKKLTLGYLEAVAKHQYDKVEGLLVPDLRFRGPVMARSSAADFVGALKSLAAIHVRNDVKRVFVDGDQVCVIYDFVTDTTAGALPAVEWLQFEGDRISSIDLYYDRLPWQQTVMPAIAERGARQAAQPVA